MIKWARGKLYHGNTGETAIGHSFMFGEKHFTFKNLSKGEYPPFDCVSLTKEHVIGLRDFLNECLDEAVND